VPDRAPRAALLRDLSRRRAEEELLVPRLKLPGLVFEVRVFPVLNQSSGISGIFSDDSLAPLEHAEPRAAVSEAHSLHGVSRVGPPGAASWAEASLSSG